MPLVWAAFAFPLCGQRLVDSGFRGSSYSFHSYRPRTIRGLEEIPATVISTLNSHLKDRLGEKFFSKLKFDWGEKVDLVELYKVEPYWKDWKVATYSVVFHFSDKSKGLKAFYCHIGLDEAGQVLDEINLPKISEQPQKAKILPVKNAIDIAGGVGFNPRSTPDFEYNEETDSFVWIFHDGTPRLTEKICTENSFLPFGQGPIARLIIEARTGKILKTNCYRILV